MAKWAYNLKMTSGAKLKELVNGDETLENCAVCIEQIRSCCSEMMLRLSKSKKDNTYYYNEFQELYNVMDGESEIIRDNSEELLEWGFSNPIELVNTRLEEFYNICDGCRVWVGMI